jgi:hypothetical protein
MFADEGDRERGVTTGTVAQYVLHSRTSRLSLIAALVVKSTLTKFG